MRKNSGGVGRKVAIAAALLNSATYVGARIYWHAKRKTAAELEVVREAEDGKPMTYLVAGCVNNPKWAFSCLMDKIDGGITFVNYANRRGCSMRQITRRVINDIRERGYDKVRIVGISIGDYVGRWAEAELENVSTVAINPEPSSEFLRPYAKWGLRIVAPLMEALTVPLGWLSHGICVCKDFSFTFLADQYRDIGYLDDAPHCVSGTEFVISSGRMDEFLRQDVIDEFFKGVPMTIIDVHHGTTEANPKVYAQAWDEMTAKKTGQ